jgi:adenine-specific DNA methylase
MSEKATDETESSESKAPDRVAIEGKLPLTAIDIESQKDMKSGRYHALRSLHKWFAARPTPVARLSVLASAYPGKVDSDELLKLMQIGPKVLDEGIADYVESKFAESKGSGTLDDHYGYSNPNTQSPTTSEKEKLHQTLREAWGGELPTVLDPTAGRGIIPFEAIRYGLPAKANELNPVPTLIMKAGLEYAPEVGSLKPDIIEWRDKIHEEAKKNIKSYYPTEKSGRRILNAAYTYTIQCDSCGGEIPLVKKWWLNKTANGGDAVQPEYIDGSVEYNHIKVQNTNNYDPTDGPVTRQSAECPHCDYPVEKEEIKSALRKGNFTYSIYGVNYETESGERGFRGGSDVDERGLKKAKERVESDFDLLTFLATRVDVSSRSNDPRAYGMEEWRDIFTPRQLITHYEYYQAFEKYVEDIFEQYDKKTAEAMSVLLTFGASRSVNFNSRIAKWRDSRGYGGEMLADNTFPLKKMAVDNNLSAPRRGYINHTDHVIESYEKLVSYISDSEAAELASMDAANLSDKWSPESIDIAVVDPPYYSSILYAELSDVFYVIQKEYLQEIQPSLFSSNLTDKESEAVAHPYRFEDIAEDSQTKKELADEHYESKMNDIFDNLHTLLNPEGVMTLMFTHRDMDAWDTMTTALIEAGFTITATHPIKTEMSDRIAMQGSASAESSILLVGRKRDHSDVASTTLWEEVEDEFYAVAEEEAKEILDSGYTISKTDTAIAAYGPTLQKFAEKYPVVTKKGEAVRPRKALNESRKAVTSVLAERFLDTEGISQLDSLTRWYILSWLIYENETIPFDEANQLGVAAGVNIEDIKRSTKLWRGGKEVELQDPDGRVQDIVMLRSDSVDDPSSRKYPVNPTDSRFTYTIDAIHAALHVYDRQGAQSAWDWLTERNYKSDDAFEVAVTALLEALPEDEDMHENLMDLISGQTGDYLDISVDHINVSGVDRQTSLGDHTE